ncbi:MAG: hypothetical protein GY820_28580 [Gammaproteobacteria bacterium]|nr:hypothetical protein [Gammaproteobacteria bacterium]
MEVFTQQKREFSSWRSSPNFEVESKVSSRCKVEQKVERSEEKCRKEKHSDMPRPSSVRDRLPKRQFLGDF